MARKRIPLADSTITSAEWSNLDWTFLNIMRFGPCPEGKEFAYEHYRKGVSGFRLAEAVLKYSIESSNTGFEWAIRRGFKFTRRQLFRLVYARTHYPRQLDPGYTKPVRFTLTQMRYCLYEYPMPVNIFYEIFTPAERRTFIECHGYIYGGVNLGELQYKELLKFKPYEDKDVRNWSLE